MKPYIQFTQFHPELGIGEIPVARGFGATPVVFHKSAFKENRDTDPYRTLLDMLASPVGKTGSVKRMRASVERSFRFIHEDTQTTLVHPAFGPIGIFVTHGIESQQFWEACEVLDPPLTHNLDPEEMVANVLAQADGQQPFCLSMIKWIVETAGAAKAIRAIRQIPDHSQWGHNLAFFLDLADLLIVEKAEEVIGSACASPISAMTPLAMCRI